MTYNLIKPCSAERILAAEMASQAQECIDVMEDFFDLGNTIYETPMGILEWNIDKKRLYLGGSTYFIKLNEHIINLTGNITHDIKPVLQYINENVDFLNGKLTDMAGEELLKKIVELDEFVKKHQKKFEIYDIMAPRLVEHKVFGYGMTLWDKNFDCKLVVKPIWCIFMDANEKEWSNPDYCLDVAKTLVKRSTIKKFNEWKEIYDILGHFIPMSAFYSLYVKRNLVELVTKGKRTVGVDKETIKQFEELNKKLDIDQIINDIFTKVDDTTYQIKFKNMDEFKEKVDTIIHNFLVSKNIITDDD